MKTTTNTKTVQTTLNLRHEPIAFVDGGLARNFAANCIKPQRVMLGCDGRFWIVCPADADRLERNGYQYA
jgi:hypothetical protein